MRSYIKKLILLCVLALPLLGHAQDKDISAGNDYYAKQSYGLAIESYLKAFEKEANQENEEAILKLADSYRMIGNTREAAQWYSQVADSANLDTEDMLHYAQVLMANEDYDEARQWFLDYAKSRPSDSRGKAMAAACANPDQFQQNTEYYNTSSIKTGEERSAFSPAFFEEGLVFVSERQDFGVKRTYGWTGSGLLDLYFIENKDGDWSKPKPFSGKLKSGSNEGPVSISKDGQLIILTRNSSVKSAGGLQTLQLFQAEKKGGGWGTVKPLPFNNDANTLAHPALSADGKTLFFVGNISGTKGGTDIFMSTKNGDSWSTPKNLGSGVNTSGNELFPFVHPDGTLYFASDGHPGLGGLDIFIAREVNGQWQMIKNVGAPINSSKDDFSMIVDDAYETGYFSSNRANGVDHLYRIQIENDIDLRAEPSAQAADVVAITGTLTNEKNKGAEGINVTLFNKDGDKVASTKTKKDGSFNFENLPPDGGYAIKVDDPEDGGDLFIEMALSDADGVQKKIDKTKVKDAMFQFETLPAMAQVLEELGVEDTELDIDLGNMGIIGKVTDKENKVQPGVNMVLMDENNRIIKRVKTDDKGIFRFENLPTDENYKIKIDEADDTGFLVDMFMEDDKGNPTRLVQHKDKNGNFIFENLPAAQTTIALLGVEDTELQMDDNTIGIFGRIGDENNKDQAGISMVLMDENNKIIRSTKTNAKGVFKFENLPADGNYKIKIDEADDTGFLVDMFMADDQGNTKRLIQRRNAEGLYEFENLPAATSTLAQMDVQDTQLDIDPGMFGIKGQIAGQDKQMKPGVQVKLVDENGKVVATTTTDKDGKFKFENLPTDMNYRIDIDDANDTGFLVEMYMEDDKGNTKRLVKRKDDEGLFVFENLPASPSMVNMLGVEDTQLEIDAGNLGIIGKVTDENNKLKPGINMVLLDENNKIIKRTKTDGKGVFRFENLPTDQNYKIKIDEADDTGFLVEMFMEDDKGNTTHLTKRKTQDGMFVFENLPASSATIATLGVEDTELKMDDNMMGIFGKVGDENNKARSGVKMVLLDENNKVVRSTKTDSKGVFSFENLPTDGNYKIKIDEADDTGFLVDMYLADDQGHTKKLIQNRNAEGLFEFENLPVSSSTVAKVDVEDTKLDIDLGNMGFMGSVQDKNNKAKPGVEMLLLDEDGNVIGKTKTDAKGKFVFENLPTDQKYSIRMADADDTNLSLDMVMMDDKGNRTALKQSKTEDGLFEFENLPASRSALTVLGVDDTNLDIDVGNMGFVGKVEDKNNKVQPGVKMELLDENGNVVATTTTDSKGIFRFENLPTDQNYSIRMNDAQDTGFLVDMFMEDDKGNTKRLVKHQQKDGTFSFENLPASETMVALLGVEDTNLDIDAGQMGFIGKLEDKNNNAKGGVTMELLDDNGNVIATTKTDSKGNFAFENLPTDQNYRIRTKGVDDTGLSMEMFMEDDKGNKTRLTKSYKDGMFEFENLPVSTGMATNMKVDDTGFNVALPDTKDPVKPTPKGKFSFETIYYPYESHLLQPDATAILDRVAEAMQQNPDLVLEVSSHTDTKGESDYNLKLSKRRTERVVRYLTSKGVPRNRIEANWFGEERPVVKDTDAAGNHLEGPMGQNRRTELRGLPVGAATQNRPTYIPIKTTKIEYNKAGEVNNGVIYYPFESHVFEEDALQVLDKVAITLDNNPELTVRVESHTDSKGPSDYNMKLSKRRTDKVVRYLTSQGIKRNRIEAKWYGEEQLLENDFTADGTEIPQAMQKNRRTVLTILGR